MKYLRLEIKERVCVKKNNRRLWIDNKGRRLSVPSLAFERSRDKITKAIFDELEERGVKNVGFDVLFKKTQKLEISTTFYVPGKYRVDGDNLHTSILDILQHAKVIENDNGVIRGTYLKVNQSKEWLIVIEILDKEIEKEVVENGR